MQKFYKRFSISALLTDARKSFGAIAVCAMLIAQSVVPATAYAIATMVCGSRATGQMHATRIVTPQAATETAAQTVMPECCKRMGLSCPMRRTYAMSPLSQGHVRPIRLTRAASAADRPVCLLTVTKSGSDRDSGLASPVPVASPQPAVLPLESVVPPRSQSLLATAAWHTRPPPLTQSRLALSSRPLRAPPTA